MRAAIVCLILPLWVLPAAAEESRAPSVTVTRAEMRDIRERLPVTGSFVAREEVMVTAEIDGLPIVEILVEEGDRVTEGQVLARLDRRTLDVLLAQNTAQIARAEAAIAQARSQIAEADASRAQAEQSLDRAQALARTGATSAEILDQRTAQARVAEARAAQSRQLLAVAEADRRLVETQRRDLELRLSRTEIKARGGGIISRRVARLGAIAAGAGEPLFRIIADGAIELEADVPETSLARLAPGQPAAVDPIGREGAAIPGRVRLVAPEINRQTRLGRVRMALDRPDGVAIGAFGRGLVEVARTEGVVVPLSAVLFASGGAAVQVVKDGVVETRAVETGLRADGLIQIRSGVAAGEEVVTVSGTFLRAGDRVRPVRAAERSAAR